MLKTHEIQCPKCRTDRPIIVETDLAAGTVNPNAVSQHVLYICICRVCSFHFTAKVNFNVRGVDDDSNAKDIG